MQFELLDINEFLLQRGACLDFPLSRNSHCDHWAHLRSQVGSHESGVPRPSTMSVKAKAFLEDCALEAHWLRVKGALGHMIERASSRRASTVTSVVFNGWKIWCKQQGEVD